MSAPAELKVPFVSQLHGKSLNLRAQTVAFIFSVDLYLCVYVLIFDVVLIKIQGVKAVKDPLHEIDVWEGAVIVDVDPLSQVIATPFQQEVLLELEVLEGMVKLLREHKLSNSWL